MNKIEIHNGYIFEFHDQTNLADEILNDVQNESFDWTTSKTGKQGVQIFSNLVYPNSQYYYNKKAFSWFDECLQQVSNFHFQTGKLSIIDSWVHKSKFGEKSSSHWHSMSIFSGLFYLTDHPNTLTHFELQNDFHTKYEWIFGTILKKNSIDITSNSQKGKLLIWPSYINHYVDAHKYKDPRYTLAFNTFIEGNLCDIPGARLDISLNNHNN
jgi:hypothetical protein